MTNNIIMISLQRDYYDGLLAEKAAMKARIYELELQKGCDDASMRGMERRIAALKSALEWQNKAIESRDARIAELEKIIDELHAERSEIYYACPACGFDNMPNIDELKRGVSRRDELLRKGREVLEEVALPPYPDSNLASLLETLRVRARNVLEILPKEDRKG